jgi:hypothetical protein
MTILLPSFLQRDRAFNIIKKLYEQALFHYLEDDGVSHHTDLGIL